MIRQIHKELGIPDEYGENPLRPLIEEATVLTPIGPNIVGREQSLTPETAVAWRNLVAAAAIENISLLIVSGFRSIAYQTELFKRKLAVGQKIEDILRINVAPGYSHHHTGRAVDIATPDFRPLTEEFENSPAFGWLQVNAGEFGFTMPYDRDNRWGIAYEPWHWFLKKEDQS